MDKMVLLSLAIKKGEGSPLSLSLPLLMLPGNKLDYLRYHLAQRFLACPATGWMTAGREAGAARRQLWHSAALSPPFHRQLLSLPPSLRPLKCNTGGGCGA